VFLKKVSGLEAVYQDYAPRGVKFYYVYKSLAHPETNGYVNAYTLDDRLHHIKEAKQRIPTNITWLADNMANDLKRHLLMHGAHNSEFVFDPLGKLVRRRFWSNPGSLRRDLEELVGPVENPTDPAYVDVQFTPRTLGTAHDNVPPPRLPVAFRAVTVRPLEHGAQPFYVKLRAMAHKALVKEGSGKLFLAFHLDPIYSVNWNSLAGPLQYEITLPSGATATPQPGAQANEDSDMEPREFFVELRDLDRGDSIQVTVRYFVCSHEEGWCKAVTQSYQVLLDYEQN
jgi:hypothetical protein